MGFARIAPIETNPWHLEEERQNTDTYTITIAIIEYAKQSALSSSVI